MHHKLCAVAQAKYRDSQFEQLSGIGRRVCFVTTVWSSGKDDSLGIHCLNLLNASPVGVYFTVNIAFSDTPCNELVVLAAKINDDYLFLIHSFSSFLCCHTIYPAESYRSTGIKPHIYSKVYYTFYPITSKYFTSIRTADFAVRSLLSGKLP